MTSAYLITVTNIITGGSMASKNRILSRKLRLALRTGVATALPGPIFPRNRIAVCGMPRSGTSWIAKCLSLARGVSYYYEPDRFPGEAGAFSYLPPGGEAPLLEQELDKMWKGRFTERFYITEKDFREILFTPFARSVLVKWVWLTPCLNWIACRDPNLTVVQTVRHPIPQFLSWKKKGWSPEDSLERVKMQRELLDGPLRDYKRHIVKASGFWECAAMLWGVNNTLALRAHRPNWVLREHEWFCKEPKVRVNGLMEKLGLEPRPDLDAFIDGKSSAGPGYGAPRDPRSEIWKWRGAVTDSEVDIVASSIAIFDLPFYKDFSPDSDWMRASTPGLY